MNPLLTGIPPSLIRELNAKKRPTSIDLGLGEPVLRPDPAPFRAATAWVEAHGCPYSPNNGFDELRAAIAAHYRLPGLDQPENVCVTVGSQEALYLALKALVDPARHEVLLATPAFPLYAKLCQMEGLRCKQVEFSAESGFRPRADAILAAVNPHTRLIILASPANPTGRVWPEAELRLLGDGLRSTFAPIYILSDEVYHELYYTEAPPSSPATFYGRTLVASSLSKSCALTGLRLGYLLAPTEVAAPVFKAHQFVVSCAGTFDQRVALEIFRDPARLSAHRPIYQQRRGLLLSALARAGLEHVAPEGGFYCMVRLSGEWAEDSMGTVLTLLERKDVLAIPGAAFGAEGWLRISWAGGPADVETGLSRIAELMTERR